MMPDREKYIEVLSKAAKTVKEFNEDTPIKISLECIEDILELLKEQEEEHKRLLSWLSKFCRHIDNGDKWLTDEENLAFFKEKMKQQFDWDTD